MMGPSSRDLGVNFKICPDASKINQTVEVDSHCAIKAGLSVLMPVMRSKSAVKSNKHTKPKSSKMTTLRVGKMRMVLSVAKSNVLLLD